MKIEIVEFYPMEHDERKEFLNGTLRVKLLDIGIHILGIYVSKKKDFWFFNLPGKLATHHETGESVRYPFIVFEDLDKQKDLITAIREQGRAFIEKRLVDVENPLVFPQKSKIPSKQVQPSKNDNNSTAVKETVIEKNNKLIASIASKIWVDPPKRKLPTKKRAFRS
jgi:hypothetical protein